MIDKTSGASRSLPDSRSLQTCTNCGKVLRTRFANQLCSDCDRTLPATLYILCFGRPTFVRQRDYLMGDRSDYPITHYVGITRRRNPRKRIYEHGRGSAAAVVELREGVTRVDEDRVKRSELCPKCGGSLNYFLENPDRHEGQDA